MLKASTLWGSLEDSMSNIGVRPLGYNPGPLASRWSDFVKKKKKITLAKLSKLQFVHLVKWE